eukprot:62050-Chlamydomonas_euryale.AAC.1
MVYVQPDLLGWRPVMTSWLSTLPAGVTNAHKACITSLFDWLVPPALRVATKMLRQPQAMQDINLVVSLMRLLTAHLDDFADPASEALRELSDAQQAAWLQCLFLFALVWSVGGCTDDEGRRTFDRHLRKLLANQADELACYITG